MSRLTHTRFGRYFLLDFVARGGMAEIYRAVSGLADGFGRVVILKLVHSAHSSDAHFLQMFRSEIKVTMGLSHPNIVQVFDCGEEDGSPYIAMEYVEGKSLRQLVTHATKSGKPLPIELILTLIEQAANGLHYAHSYRDKITGEPLNIVHRDVSPQNLILSYDGILKIIDFGVAKATTNLDLTRSGTIKGKPSYMSPEQIYGLPLDGRCDIFALGSVFWELLIGKKLFQPVGENKDEFSILRQIENCKSHIKRPSDVRAGVPRAVDRLVLKALEKKASDRYQNGEEFAREIRQYLNRQHPDYSLAQVRQYLSEAFEKEIKDDRERLQTLSQQAKKVLEGRRGDTLPSASKISIPTFSKLGTGSSKSTNPPAPPGSSRSYATQKAASKLSKLSKLSRLSRSRNPSTLARTVISKAMAQGLFAAALSAYLMNFAFMTHRIYDNYSSPLLGRWFGKVSLTHKIHHRYAEYPNKTPTANFSGKQPAKQPTRQAVRQTVRRTPTPPAGAANKSSRSPAKKSGRKRKRSVPTDG